MKSDNKNEIEQKTEESKEQAIKETSTECSGNNKAIHTINPFTGTEVDITAKDLEGVEKKIEADRERD